ncbi:helix-turn-helix domain-containing protein [Actinomadura decatromicini]|uniref:Helix-turn-helix domain-containing protein n=1 Tax=Actinomadura decatromicini TaxID=2604572 RepID=A0A5D3FB51_9ACTN|nr:helix-turn-helix transcriptional regulator [Actinomadura decatromicini]TYK45134.1 helix-turn-helix domain-containing protein [Actinomadura decatromicini]
MRTSPVGRRRHLSRELLRLRESTGQTADQVARALGWTPSSLTHIERNDWKLPKLHLVEQLLDAYGVTEDAEPQRRAELLTYAEEGRNRGWWERHKLKLSEAESIYIGLEQEASLIRIVAPVQIPALLQAPDYARALHQDPARGEAAAAMGTERQRLLQEPDPLTMWAVVGEGVLWQQVGGPDVHAAQLDHLAKLASSPNVRLSIYPFEARRPLPPGFAHLSFENVIDPEVVYIPSAGGETWREDPNQVTPFVNLWEAILPSALPVKESRRRLAEIAAKAH